MLDLPECQIILSRLKNECPPSLRYHTLPHTLDVYNCAMDIAKAENINIQETKLIGIAAVYHDSGYLIQSDRHEQISCEIAQQYLPNYGYSDFEVQGICELIMATVIPQNPKTHLEKIICDADMDYLGREDFFTTGNLLFEEFKLSGILSDEAEWNRIQVDFLNQHRFFTPISIRLRQPTKHKNLEILKAKL